MESVASAARRRIVADRALVEENEQLRTALAATRRKADIDNPAQPVASPPAEGETPTSPPDATVDVESIGGAVAVPDLSVPGDVTTPGMEVPTSPPTDQVDVEKPIEGVDRPDPDATEEVVPDSSANTNPGNAMGGDWINPGSSVMGRADRAALGRMSGQVRDRIWASVRLARLQIQAGIVEGHDDLEVGRQIEGSQMSMEAIQAASSALSAAARVRPAMASRSQAPGRVATQQRHTPSLASGREGVVGGLSVRGEDEAIFE